MQVIFPNLIGNKRIKDTIGLDVLNNVSSHAYIIEGSKKSGKHILSYNIAKGLFCTNKSSDTFPCCKCRNCINVESNYNTDIITFDSKNIQKEQIENFRKSIIETINYAPNDSDYKVYIIEHAEYLNLNTQNLLLKSIEEPPKFVVFLLLTENASNLLETVRSRCQIIRMQQFTAEEIIEILKSRNIYSEEKLANASVLAFGSLGLAMDFLDNNSDQIQTDIAFELVKNICSEQKSITNQFLHDIDFKKIDFSNELEKAALYLRDIISVKNNGNIVYCPHKDDIVKLANKISILKLNNIYIKITELIDNYNSNVNTNLIISLISDLSK